MLKRLLKLMIISIILASSVIGYSLYIEPNLLIVEELNLDSPLPTKSNETLRIAQFSDTHLGPYYSIEQFEKLAQQINAEKPDLVVFTGDLMDTAKEYKDISQISSVLSMINAPLGKFAVFGNHDYGGGAEFIYEDIMNDGGFQVLVNKTKRIQVGNSYVTLSGLGEAFFGKPNPQKILQNIRNDEYNILIFHEPDLFIDVERTNVHLGLAGHSHGGQVRLPIIGPLALPAYADKYNVGLYSLDHPTPQQLYVNTGIANTRMPFRLGNIPELTIIKINL